MAYLNADQREQLRKELEGLNFIHAKRKLMLADPKGRVAFFRNAQHSGKLETRFVLEGLGTVVTLVERFSMNEGRGLFIKRSNYELESITVEPTSTNHA